MAEDYPWRINFENNFSSYRYSWETNTPERLESVLQRFNINNHTTNKQPYDELSEYEKEEARARLLEDKIDWLREEKIYRFFTRTNGMSALDGDEELKRQVKEQQEFLEAKIQKFEDELEPMGRALPKVVETIFKAVSKIERCLPWPVSPTLTVILSRLKSAETQSEPLKDAVTTLEQGGYESTSAEYTEVSYCK